MQMLGGGGRERTTTTTNNNEKNRWATLAIVLPIRVGLVSLIISPCPIHKNKTRGRSKTKIHTRDISISTS